MSWVLNTFEHFSNTILSFYSHPSVLIFLLTEIGSFVLLFMLFMLLLCIVCTKLTGLSFILNFKHLQRMEEYVYNHLQCEMVYYAIQTITCVMSITKEYNDYLFFTYEFYPILFCKWLFLFWEEKTNATVKHQFFFSRFFESFNERDFVYTAKYIVIHINLNK